MNREHVTGSPHAEEHDTFRNELASVARDGRRRWIYARQPAGRSTARARSVSVFLLAFLLSARRSSTIGGQPLMMLNVLERRFVLLGMRLPAAGLLPGRADRADGARDARARRPSSSAGSGAAGCARRPSSWRWCSAVWNTCIDGSAEQQLRRNRGPWTGDRMRAHRRSSTAIFFALSFVIANVFLAWVIGAARGSARIVDRPPARHLAGLTAIVLFSLVFYLVFARFREQACVLACPYGRMMSSLIDRRTVTVTYDSRRGEPRGRRAAGDRAVAAGDCVDCHRCVTVCPTGIDIRNGIQLECVNCAACIDACDAVMTRVGRPTGLIRLTSAEAVAGAPRQLAHGAFRRLRRRCGWCSSAPSVACSRRAPTSTC